MLAGFGVHNGRTVAVPLFVLELRVLHSRSGPGLGIRRMPRCLLNLYSNTSHNCMVGYSLHR